MLDRAGKNLDIQEGSASLIVLIAAIVLLSQLGGGKVLPILATEDDAEFDQTMEKVRVVVEDPEATGDAAPGDAEISGH